MNDVILFIINTDERFRPGCACCAPATSQPKWGQLLIDNWRLRGRLLVINCFILLYILVFKICVINYERLPLRETHFSRIRSRQNTIRIYSFSKQNDFWILSHFLFPRSRMARPIISNMKKTNKKPTLVRIEYFLG